VAHCSQISSLPCGQPPALWKTSGHRKQPRGRPPGLHTKASAAELLHAIHETGTLDICSVQGQGQQHDHWGQEHP
jgi:hypothetical protein